MDWPDRRLRGRDPRTGAGAARPRSPRCSAPAAPSSASSSTVIRSATLTRRSSTSAPNKSLWPALEPGDPPEAWFDALFERVTLEFIENGYSKTTEGARRAGTFDVFPFRFDPELQRSIFLAEAGPGSTRRQILDAYMTSYFNAWLDNANLRTGPKRVVTAFAAALAFRRRHLAAFFDDYPDGTTRHDRSRAPRLVRVQPPLQGALRVGRPRRQDVEPLDASIARSVASATATGRSSSRSSTWSRRPNR